MEFDQFQDVLLGLMSEEQLEESQSIIENLIDSSYPEYIELLMTAIQQIENERIFKVSITLLQVEVIKKRIFSDPDLAMDIIENLTPLIANILQSPSVKDNFKKIMAFVLAQLHIFVYHNTNNVDIPTYILKTFNEMPEIRKYLTYCICEISINDEDFGGFDVDDLLQILTDTEEDDSIYIPKINLFFAVAMRRPDIQVLQETFPDLFSACPEDDLDEMLLSLSDYAEHSSSFFQPYLGSLVQRLCELACDTEIAEGIRDKSMICLSSIAEGAPEMCQNTEEYYEPVFKTLIQVASEIDDDSPWEYDVNNAQPYQVALDSIAVLFENFVNPDIFVPIYEMVISVLSEDEVPWQTAYASISALAEINMLAMSSISEDLQRSLFERISMFIDIECHPRARIAVYNFISKLSAHGILYPQSVDLSSILIEPLESLMIIEDEPIAKKLAYEAYTTFISQPTSQKISLYFERFFLEIVKELQSAPEDFKIYIVRLIGPLVKSARDEAVKHFPIILKITFSLLANKNPNIQAEAILCFSLAITYVPKIEKIIQYCSHFVNHGFSLLYSNELDVDPLDHLYNAIHKLLIFMGNAVAPFAQQVLPRIIENCQESISIEETNSLESNETFKNKTLYLRISPIDSHIKQYALMTEVTEVKHALLILEAFIYSDPNFKEYLSDIYMIIDNWLTNKFAIEPLQSKCWSILDALSRIFEDQTQHLNELDEERQQQLFENSVKNIEIIFRCYISNIEQRGTPLFMSKMLKVTSGAIMNANSLKWYDSDIFEAILQTIEPLINDILAMKEKKYKEMEEYDTVDISDRFISHCDTCLSDISDMISSCFNLQPDFTNEFYNETIGPKTDDYLSNDLTLIFGITTTCIFIIYTNDMDKMLEFCDVLTKYAVSFDRTDDLPLVSLYSLGKLFTHFPLQSQEDADNFMKFFIEFFQTDQVQNDNDTITMISDFANVAFAKFLLQNMKFFAPSLVADAFLDAAPLWESPEDSDVYFQCMEIILQKGYFQIVCGNDWPEFLLGQILSGFLNHQYEEETRRKFAKTLARLYNTEEGKITIDKTLKQSFDKNKANFFWILVDLSNASN